MECQELATLAPGVFWKDDIERLKELSEIQVRSDLLAPIHTVRVSHSFETASPILSQVCLCDLPHLVLNLLILLLHKPPAPIVTISLSIISLPFFIAFLPLWFLHPALALFPLISFHPS